jgi:hypothetical protein
MKAYDTAKHKESSAASKISVGAASSPKLPIPGIENVTIPRNWLADVNLNDSSLTVDALVALASKLHLKVSFDQTASEDSAAAKHTFHHHISKLPAFTDDDSDFILSAVIERNFDHLRLHLDTFFLNHHMLDPNYEPFGASRTVHPSTKLKWKKLVYNYGTKPIEYDLVGRRAGAATYSCVFQNTPDGRYYSVKGSFLPNRLTQDVNSNRVLDILRCPLEELPLHMLMKIAKSADELQVEIKRDDTSLVSFAVPWHTRKTGFLMGQVNTSSRLDPWLGLNKSSKADPNSLTVHLCVPGTRLLAHKTALPMLLEFVSHHHLLGVDHIYLPVTLGWNSPLMTNFVGVFKSYIDEGILTVLSQAGDNMDMTPSIFGLTWHRYQLKTMQTSMILFFAKGLADYLAVFDIDEFFIPGTNYHTIQAVIQAVDVTDPAEKSRVLTPAIAASKYSPGNASSWRGGRGWAAYCRGAAACLAAGYGPGQSGGAVLHRPGPRAAALHARAAWRCGAGAQRCRPQLSSLRGLR